MNMMNYRGVEVEDLEDVEKSFDLMPAFLNIIKRIRLAINVK